MGSPEQPLLPTPEQEPAAPKAEAKDTRPRVISETSAEYLAFRQEMEQIREHYSPVFGKYALERLQTNRAWCADTLRRFGEKESVDEKTRESWVQETKAMYTGWDSETIEIAKTSLRLGLGNPDSIQNSRVIFREALQDPELKAYFESIFKDYDNSGPGAEIEAMLAFLQGNFPKSLEDKIWETERAATWFRIWEEYRKRSDALAASLAAAQAAKDESRLAELHHELSAISTEEEQKYREAEAELRLRFDKKMNSLRKEYRERYRHQHIPDEIFERMLRVHVQNFEEATSAFQEELPDMMTRFRGKIAEDIAGGKLPLEPGLVERRLAELKIVLWDPMMKEDKTMGDFNVYNALVTVRADYSAAEREHILVHELYHALSGRIVTSEVHQGRRQIMFRKTGLSFLKTKSIQSEQPASGAASPDERIDPGVTMLERSSIFEWLNEAYTEFRNLLHLERRDSDSYMPFRRLLAAMTRRGFVDMNLVRDAYFENDDPALPPEKRKAAWKALAKKLQEVYAGPEGEAELRSMARGVQMLLAVDREPDFRIQMDLLAKKAA